MCAALLVASGWVAASLLVSPEQRAASALPPEPSVITAEVSVDGLARTVAASATVEFERTYSVDGSAGATVVTRNPVTVGDEVSVCEPVAELDGRPVVTVPGQFPFYRQMEEGDTGVDVAQLRAGLRACGLDIAADGPFGADVEGALERMLSSAGYDIPAETLDVRSALLVVDGPTVTVLSVAPVGAAIEGQAAVTVGAGSPVLRASVPDDVARSLPDVDARVVIGSEEVHLDRAELVEPASADSLAIVDIDLPSETVNDIAVGADAVVTFLLEQLVSDALIVPASAMVAEGAGRTVVYVQGDDRNFTAVEVIELASLDGRTAVDANGALKEGDVVLVGTV